MIVKLIENTGNYPETNYVNMILQIMLISICLYLLFKMIYSKREYEKINGEWVVKHKNIDEYEDLLEHLEKEHPEAYKALKELDEKDE